MQELENNNINLEQKYKNINLNENISNINGVPAIQLNDGSIIPITTSNTSHVNFIKNKNIDINDKKSGC